MKRGNYKMKTKNHLTNAILTTASMNGEIIAFAPEQNETQLYTVFAQFEHEYVVWNYNAEFDGMYNGYYTTDYQIARDEFVRRLMK